MKLTYLFLCIICITSSAAQGVLVGKVLEAETKIPVQAAHVYIPTLKMGTMTNNEGNYRLDIPEGKYAVQISNIAYSTQIKNIEVKGETRLDFELSPVAVSIDEVIVTAGIIGARTENPYQVEVLSMQQMQMGGEVSLASSLTAIPGIETISMGTGIGKPVIRGLSFSRVLTLYNGTPLENHQWGADHGLGLNELGLHRVEIIKGPASLMYGPGAVGGVISLLPELMPAPGTTKGNISINGYSNTLGYKSQGGISTTNQKGFSMGAYVGAENHADYIDGTGQVVGNSRFNTQTFKTFAGMQRNWGNSRVFYSFHNQNLGIVEGEEGPEFLVTNRNDREMQLPFQQVNDHLVSWQSNIFLKNGSLNTTFGYHHNTRKEIEDEIDEVELYLLQDNISYHLQYRAPFKSFFDFTLGLQGNSLQNNNHLEALEILIPDFVHHNAGLYAIMSRKAELWNLQGGLRGDFSFMEAGVSGPQFENYGYFFPGREEEKTIERSFSGLSASFGATRIISNNISAKANISSGFRSPDPAELFSNGHHAGTSRFEMGNVEFAQEQNVQGDVAAYYSSGNFSFETSLFYNRIFNYIFLMPTTEVEPVSNVPIWRFNQDDAHLYGGEAGGSYYIKDRKLQLEQSLAIVYAERLGSLSPLPLIPPVQFKGGLNFSLPNIGNFEKGVMSVSYEKALAQERVAENELQTPGYFLLNFRFSTEVKVQRGILSLNLTGKNILNSTYYNHLSLLRAHGIYQMGRNIGVGVRYGW